MLSPALYRRSRFLRRSRLSRFNLKRVLQLEYLEARCLLATWSGDIPNGTIWTNSEVHNIVGSIRVPAGATLTVEPGTIVKTNIFAGLSIAVEGTLSANGTLLQPIVFTSMRDDTGLDGILNTADDQDTNGDGSSNGNNGDWNQIEFKPGSTGNILNRVQVRYAGAGALGAIVVDRASLSLTNSILHNSVSSGVRIQASNPILTSNTYRNNLVAAISMDLASNPTISGVTVSNNVSNALILDAGEIVGNGFWDDRDIVYRTTGDVTVPVGSSLTIGAGQVVKFREFVDDDLIVNGTLIADGTPALPIVFTSNRDDTVGGDTNNETNGSAPGNGNWGAIQLQSGSTGNVLDYVEVRYGGGNRAAALIASAPMSLTNGILRNSSSAGLRVLDASITVNESRFENNFGVAISQSTAGELNGSGISANNNLLNGIVVDGGILTSNRSWFGRGIPYRLGSDLTLSADGVINIGLAVVFDILEGIGLLGTGTVNNSGTIRKSVGLSTAIIAAKLVNDGRIQVISGSLNLSGGLAENGNATLSGASNATLSIGTHFLGDTQNLAVSPPLATVLFNGTGTSVAPQLFEAMSGDKGNVSVGFDQNLAFYSLALANNTYVKLVDSSNNAPGSGAEAVYTSNLVIPTGTTLDLNGFHVYARIANINGIVTGGSVSILPDGGPLVFDSITPGRINAIGEADDWTIFGRAGQSVTIEINTGSGGTVAPSSPPLNFVQVDLMDPNNNLVGTSSSTASGLDVTIAGVTLPIDGTYRIRLKAPLTQSNSVGNYGITAWNASVNQSPLELGRKFIGSIDTPFRVDRWTFSGTSGQVVKFILMNAESPSIQFDLTGPSGFTAFSGASTSSPDIVLPSSGTYSLTVHSSQRQIGAYAFRVDQSTITDVTLGTPLNVPLSGDHKRSYSALMSRNRSNC
ncbi:MAG: hypothetical protein SGI77_24025 [Pirellulaceae bacterium]|nr:hypothetical protein [Pirellulaceae bacterium]